MRVETASEVKSIWENHRSDNAKQLEGLTSLQRQIREQKLKPFPTVECAVKIFDVWPGSGTPYPHPLAGKPDATALVTGYLQTSKQDRKWWQFKADTVGVVVLINDDINRELILQVKRNDSINVCGVMTYLDEFEYFVGGGINCFGLSAGSLFTFRVDNAKLLTNNTV